MNNFVVHFKKSHLNKDCILCNNKNVCNACANIVTEAKVKWLSNKPIKITKHSDFEPVDENDCEDMDNGGIEENMNKMFTPQAMSKVDDAKVDDSMEAIDLISTLIEGNDDGWYFYY